MNGHTAQFCLAKAHAFMEFLNVERSEDIVFRQHKRIVRPKRFVDMELRSVIMIKVPKTAKTLGILSIEKIGTSHHYTRCLNVHHTSKLCARLNNTGNIVQYQDSEDMAKVTMEIIYLYASLLSELFDFLNTKQYKKQKLLNKEY